MPKLSKVKAFAKAQLKEKKKVRQDKKFNRKAKKHNTESDEEEDIDKIISDLNSKEKSLGENRPGKAVKLDSPPYPRVHCSWTTLPNGDVLVFGGESTHDQRPRVYNETFLFTPDKNEWRKVNTYLQPKPRCSHQAILFRDDLYTFGGEYSTSTQFYHFNDMWRLDLKNYKWEEIKTTGTWPSPRSGHRMVLWRSYILLFGGFQSNLRETRYYNDLYIFSLQNLEWRKFDFNTTYQLLPEPRAGCLFAASRQENYVLLYGGHQVQDNGRAIKGKELEDCWALDLKPLIESNNATPTWEKLKKVGHVPTIRAGFSSCYFKNMVLLFGGVTDHDDGKINLNSQFHNDLYAFDFIKRRWNFFDIKPSKDSEKSKKSNLRNHTVSDNKQPDGTDENQMDVLSSIENQNQQNFTEGVSDTNSIDTTSNKFPLKLSISKSPEDQFSPIDTKTSTLMAPLPRIKGNLSIRGNSLFLYGGLIEMDKKITYLNDCWTLNLTNRDGWECIQHSDMSIAVLDQQDLSSDSGDQLSDMDSELSPDDLVYENKSACSETSESSENFSEVEHDSALDHNLELDNLRTDARCPKPARGETLRDFFLRTKYYWIELINDKENNKKFDKNTQRFAFQLCQERYSATLS